MMYAGLPMYSSVFRVINEDVDKSTEIMSIKQVTKGPLKYCVILTKLHLI
jgi:hypothetical protein